MKRIGVLLSCVALLFFIAQSDAATTHTVKKGQSLGEIARKYHITVNDLKATNNLTSKKVAAGTKLTIPEKSSRTTGQARAESAQREASPARNGEDVTHVVRKGDTLSKIARAYSVPEADLRELNHISAGRLTTGQRLLVRKAEPAVYTVRKGDTLAKIARKFRVPPDELRDINGLGSDALRSGQQLMTSRPPAEPEAEESPVPVSAEPVKGPVLASAKLEAVKELSRSEDISQMSVTDRLTLFAKKMLHLPYRFGGNGPMGIDCSAYVQKVYSFAGVDLPRSAREQFGIGESVDKEELSIGDLVFFRTYASFPSHVGIYLGNNLFIHASSKSKRVTIDSLETPYYFRRFIGAKRVIADENVPGVLGGFGN